MDYSFPKYLLAKQTVDDRALNLRVFETLKTDIANLTSSRSHIKIIEVGAGIGTMIARLVRWGFFRKDTHYLLVDELAENIVFARDWMHRWANEYGLRHEQEEDVLRLWVDREVCVTVQFVQANVLDIAHLETIQSDVLIANALLDLLPLPDGLHRLLKLVKPNGLAWLTINFDGVTSFEPCVNTALDNLIESLYHQTMDSRATGGDSKTGRHLFAHFKHVGAEILAAGSSDWVVHSHHGRYPADEAYFLYFILHFFESSLGEHPQLEKASFSRWLQTRREQIDRGELVYIAHQIDFLVRR
jgi:hypothetical protein